MNGRLRSTTVLSERAPEEVLLAILGAHSSLPRTEIPRKRNPEAVGQHRRNVEKDDGSNFACASVFESTLQRDLSESGPQYFRSQRSEQHETPTN